MHNRVRMITSSFLCKHLLVDWRFGEAYFALKLFDFELASNNGNWQWAAGSGCDAAPYFRIFNPYTQIEKFDKKFEYINKWVPEYNSPNYSNDDETGYIKIELIEPNIGFGSSIFATIFNESVTESSQNPPKRQPVSVSPPNEPYSPMIKDFFINY